MANPRPSGVFAAALTPVKPDGSLDLENVLPYLEFLANRGCNGTLLFGTTGEGPSFSPVQRIALGRVATQIHATHPDFMLLMGTGTPSLTETIELSRAAFEIGMQGVVVLPPYFNRQASDDGLFAWFSQVIRQAVPSDGFLLGYHIPQMTGVSLTIPLIDRLKTAFPIQFAGIKNSWTDPKLTTALGNQFGADLVVMTGFDHLFQLSLNNHASGCITASATLVSPLLQRLWLQFQSGEDTSSVQLQLNNIREVLDQFAPAPAMIKGLLAKWHKFPHWRVIPPLLDMSQDALERASQALNGPF